MSATILIHHNNTCPDHPKLVCEYRDERCWDVPGRFHFQYGVNIWTLGLDVELFGCFIGNPDPPTTNKTQNKPTAIRGIKRFHRSVCSNFWMKEKGTRIQKDASHWWLITQDQGTKVLKAVFVCAWVCNRFPKTARPLSIVVPIVRSKIPMRQSTAIASLSHCCLRFKKTAATAVYME